MWISEQLLYLLARSLHKSDVCHSAEMKESLASMEKYDEYRSGRADIILTHAERFGVDLREKVVLDFGCADGAISPHYLNAGAREVVGLDIDAGAIARAQARYSSDRVRFHACGSGRTPLPDNSV